MARRFTTTVATVLTAALMCAACTGSNDVRSGNGGDGFAPDVLMATEDFTLSNVECFSEPGQTNHDGEIVDDIHWKVRGVLANELDTGSPAYELRAVFTHADGTEDETGGTLFRPVAALDSADFRILVGSELKMGGPITRCTVVVYDSVLNYT